MGGQARPATCDPKRIQTRCDTTAAVALCSHDSAGLDTVACWRGVGCRAHARARGAYMSCPRRVVHALTTPAACAAPAARYMHTQHQSVASGQAPGQQRALTALFQHYGMRDPQSARARREQARLGSLARPQQALRACALGAHTLYDARDVDVGMTVAPTAIDNRLPKYWLRC